MELKLLEWIVRYGTLLAALIGAATGTTTMVLALLKRREEAREALRKRNAETIWAEVEPRSGGETGLRMTALFRNPSSFEVEIMSVEVLRPKRWVAIVYRSSIRNDDPFDFAGAASKVAVSWTLPPSPDAPSKTVLREVFMVAPSGTTERDTRPWPPLNPPVSPIACAIRFSGYSRNATREPISFTWKSEASA